MKEIKYFKLKKFQKEFDKLEKRFKTLSQDFEILKQASIELLHIYNKNNNGIFLIPNFNNKEIQIYKVKRFACRYLKGKGGNTKLRVIYAFYPKLFKIEFLEIYFKGDKILENKERIKEYLKQNLK